MEEIHACDVEGYALHLRNSENMAAVGRAIQSHFNTLGVKITIDTQPCSDYRDLLFVDEAASFGIVLAGTRSQDKEMLGARISFPSQIYSRPVTSMPSTTRRRSNLAAKNSSMPSDAPLNPSATDRALHETQMTGKRKRRNIPSLS